MTRAAKWAAVLVLAPAASTPAMTDFHKSLPEDRPFEKIGVTYETPHMKWAKPFAGGPIRVCVLAPLTRHRETVELAQRLEIEFSTMIVSSPSRFAGDYLFLNEEETLELNLRKLAPEREYDVIVLAAPWHILPKPMQLAIIRRARGGAGLLFTDFGGSEDFLKSAGRIEEAERYKGEKPTLGEPAEKTDPATGLGLVEKPADKPARDWVTADQFIRIGLSNEALLVNGLRVTEGSFGKARVVSVFGLRGSAISAADPPLAPKVRLAGDRRRRILYDFHMAHLAKAVVYAAGKVPSAVIHSLKMPQPAAGSGARDEQAGAVSAQDAAKQGLTVEVAAAEAMTGVDLELTVVDELRRERGRTARTVDLRKGRQAIQLDLPELPEGGQHFAVVRLLKDGRAVHWDAAAIRVRQANGVREFSVKPFYRRGETIAASVALRKPLEAGQRLVVEIEDNLGRVLCRQTATSGDRTDLPAASFVPVVPLYFLRARILEGDKLLYDYDASFLVEMAPPDNYLYVVWGGSSSHYYRQVLKDRYHELGVNAVSEGDMDAAASNLRLWCYSSHVSQYRESEQERKERIRRETDQAAKLAAVGPEIFEGRGGGPAGLDANLEEGRETDPQKAVLPVSNPCFNDPAWAEKETQRLRESVAHLRRFSPVGYSLGDENQIGLTCHCTHCTTGFRRWLQEDCRNLEGLNRRWDSSFASWDEVKWPAFRDAKTPGQLAAWHDRERFTEWTFNRAHLIMKQAIQAGQPGAWVGFTSFFLPQPERGVNALLAFPWADFNTQYQDPRWEDLMRVLSPRPAFCSVTQGTYAGRKHRLEFLVYPWQEFLRGATGKLWWRGEGFRDAVSCLDPGYEPLPSFHNTIRMAEEVRRGLFHLVRASRFRNCGIRVLYSQTDMYAAFVKDPKRGPSLWNDRRMGMIGNLRNAGWQFDYMTPEQLASGDLQDTRLLFLPGTECLSESMAEELDRFVRRGGVLVADVVPGGRDLHLKPRPQPAPAGLFVDLPPGQGRRCGEGHVFLAGDLLLSEGHKEPKSRAFLDAALAAAKPQRGWALLDDRGEPASGWELFTYEQGEAMLIGITAQDRRFKDAAAAYTLKLERKVAVYDVREGKALGEGAEFRLELDPAKPLILAALPQALGKLQATTHAATAEAGSSVGVEIRIEPAPIPATACCVEIMGPGGKPLRHYRRPVLVRNGRASLGWDTALSDVGEHTVLVQETISGQTVRSPEKLTDPAAK